jgi:hypothetical protein
MAHPSKDKGDRHERATVAALTALFEGTGLTVEKTKAGYERDGGDLHILTPAREVLFVVQCKDWAVKDWRLPEWLRELAGQLITSHATRGFLSVKRPRVLDAASAYAMCDLAAMAALVRELYQLHVLHTLDEERARAWRERTEVAEQTLDALREQGIEIPRLPVDAALSTSRKSIMNGDGPDPDALQDPPGTVRGAVVYPWRRSEADPVSP